MKLIDNKKIPVLIFKTTRIWMKISILYLKIFFIFSLIFLILLWSRICWWIFEIFVTVMLRNFLLNTSKWMLSDKILTWKVKKNEGIYTLIFLNFSWKIYKKIFYWKLCDNRKKFSISIFWIRFLGDGYEKNCNDLLL